MLPEAITAMTILITDPVIEVARRPRYSYRYKSYRKRVRRSLPADAPRKSPALSSLPVAPDSERDRLISEALLAYGQRRLREAQPPVRVVTSRVPVYQTLTPPPPTEAGPSTASVRLSLAMLVLGALGALLTISLARWRRR